MADARLVARLTESPEFQELKRANDEAREDYFNSLARTLYTNPESVTVTPLALAYKRGWYRGREDLLNQPTTDAARIAKAADRSSSDQEN